MEILFIMVLFGVVTSLLAENKGYSAVAGFFAGLLLGVFGLLIYLVLPKREKSGVNDGR